MSLQTNLGASVTATGKHEMVPSRGRYPKYKEPRECQGDFFEKGKSEEARRLKTEVLEELGLQLDL